MKSILLIGLGRFGRHIAMHLDQLGHQVMAVDNSDERAEDVLPIVTNAQIGDSTNEEFLESLGVRNYDVCIVAIGHDFQSSLETTSLLKDMGAKMVVSRATTDVQEKFLLRNGADEVIYPEKQLPHQFQTGCPSYHKGMLQSDVSQLPPQACFPSDKTPVLSLAAYLTMENESP